MRTCWCWIMIAMFPLSAIAFDGPTAMLYTHGTAWINGKQVPRTSAVFSGDVVQTQTESPASINALGSNVEIAPESLIKFEGNAICVEHGQVNVVTSRQMLAYAGGLTISPFSSDSTQYEVMDVDGSVHIAARKGDVKVSGGSKTITVAEGQQTAQDESREKNRCGGKGAGALPQGGGAVPPGVGGIMSSQAAIWTATGVVGGVMIWVFTRPDDPISPYKPGGGR